MNLLKNSVANELIPSDFYLSQNYPNPFKEKTIIKYCIPYKTNVAITIFDSERNVIEQIKNSAQEAGTYKFEFSAQRNNGYKKQSALLSDNYDQTIFLPEGIYYYRLDAGCYFDEKEMNLLR